MTESPENRSTLGPESPDNRVLVENDEEVPGRGLWVELLRVGEKLKALVPVEPVSGQTLAPGDRVLVEPLRAVPLGDVPIEGRYIPIEDLAFCTFPPGGWNLVFRGRGVEGSSDDSVQVESVLVQDDLADTEEWLDSLATDSPAVDHTEDLRAIAENSDELVRVQARLIEAIEIARAHGRSWTEIGMRLGVTRQAARQRYG